MKKTICALAVLVSLCACTSEVQVPSGTETVTKDGYRVSSYDPYGTISTNAVPSFYVHRH